jgi:hypothetical protein
MTFDCSVVFLGDVIREQEGRDAYELVEQGKLSVAFRRDPMPALTRR